jgi:hypothetical protein
MIACEVDEIVKKRNEVLILYCKYIGIGFSPKLFVLSGFVDCII